MLATANTGEIGRGLGKNKGEWTVRVEISKEEIPGSKRSMYGYIQRGTYVTCGETRTVIMRDHIQCSRRWVCPRDRSLPAVIKIPDICNTYRRLGPRLSGAKGFVRSGRILDICNTHRLLVSYLMF